MEGAIPSQCARESTISPECTPYLTVVTVVTPETQCSGLQLLRGTKNLLDGLHRPRPARGFPATDLVGPCRDHPHRFLFLVGGVPQRLVLNHNKRLHDIPTHPECLPERSRFGAKRSSCAVEGSLREFNMSSKFAAQSPQLHSLGVIESKPNPVLD